LLFQVHNLHRYIKGRVVATYLRGEKIYASGRDDGRHRHHAAGPYGKPLLRK
jgi:hypothetical protein